MAVTGDLARLELRRGWRSLVPIALLVATVAAIVLWSAAAARRTDTAFERMLDGTNAWHVLVNPDNGAMTELTTDDLRALDGVTGVGRLEALLTIPEGAASLEDFVSEPGIVWGSDGVIGFEIGRPIMTEGRFPDPAATDELFADTEFAAIYDLTVGDVVPLRLVGGDEGVPIAALQRAIESGEMSLPDFEAAVIELLTSDGFAPAREVTVTGIGRFPDFVAVDSGYELPSAMVTPALFDELGRPALLFGGWGVRLDDPSRVDGFRDAVDALVPDETIAYQTMAGITVKAERRTSTPGGVLAIFAVVVLLIGLLVIGQAIQRWLASRAGTRQVFHALGADHGVVWRSSTVQLGVAALAGFVTGAVGAALASPIAPVGPARLVEISPGWAIDWLVVAVGAIALVLAVAASSIVVWRATRPDARRPVPGPRPLTGRVLDAGAAPIPVALGGRFALERDRGSSGRLAIIGSLTGVMFAVAAVVFTASIDHVTDTPRLFGTSWSATVMFTGEIPEYAEVGNVIDDVMASALAGGDVFAASSLHAGEIELAGRRVPVVAYRDSDRPVQRTITDGRAPSGPGEIALGRNTLGALGLSIGDTVAYVAPEGSGEATVVGTAVLPAIGTYSGADKTALGDGAMIDPSLLHTFFSFSRIALDVDPDADLEILGARLEGAYSELGPLVEPSGEPAEIDSLRALAAFPRWLAVALMVLVGIPVVHSLVESARSHRRDLAVLSALGARPRTVRWIGVAQGATVAVAGVVIGAPLGIVLGRWSWSLVATSFGTVAEPQVPVGPVAAILLGVLAVGVAVGGALVWRLDRARILRSLRPE